MHLYLNCVVIHVHVHVRVIFATTVGIIKSFRTVCVPFCVGFVLAVCVGLPFHVLPVYRLTTVCLIIIPYRNSGTL